MKENSRWGLLLLVVCLTTGGWYEGRSENLARIQFDRARQQWRQQHFDKAIVDFEALLQQYPETSYAPRALWEIASIYYYSLDQVDRATAAYQRMVREYSADPLAIESQLKLAELYEREFGDLAQARDHWERALNGHLSPGRRRRVELKVADTFLYSSRLEEASARLQALLDVDDDIAQQARLRLGTILQIRREHAAAVPIFTRVLTGPECGPCRLQARLALIESYEVLDQLPNALREARHIDAKAYSAELKNGIINRLLEKQRSFRPRLTHAD